MFCVGTPFYDSNPMLMPNSFQYQNVILHKQLNVLRAQKEWFLRHYCGNLAGHPFRDYAQSSMSIKKGNI